MTRDLMEIRQGLAQARHVDDAGRRREDGPVPPVGGGV